jgi:hypothetical protein
MTRAQPKMVSSTIPSSQPSQRGGPERPDLKEGASQSWGIGDLIYLNTSSGKFEICTDSSGRHNSPIAGSAQKAATGVTDSPVYFHAIRPDDIYVMNLYHSTPGSAVSAVTLIGKTFGIIKAGGLWMVDIENTTVEDATNALARVRIDSFEYAGLDTNGNWVQQDLVNFGDRYALARVRFLPFSIATDGSPMTRILQYM